MLSYNFVYSPSPFRPHMPIIVAAWKQTGHLQSAVQCSQVAASLVDIRAPALACTLIRPGSLPGLRAAFPHYYGSSLGSPDGASPAHSTPHISDWKLRYFRFRLFCRFCLPACPLVRCVCFRYWLCREAAVSSYDPGEWRSYRDTWCQVMSWPRFLSITLAGLL